MSQPLVFDYILGKMRLSDALLASAATISIPDPLIVNQLSVKSLASINLLMVNSIYGSSASVGHLTTNTLNVYSTASIYLGHFVGLTASNISSNTIQSSNIFSSTATIGNLGLVNLQWDLVNGNGTAEGQMSWDSVNQTVTLGMAGGNVDVALGLETLFPKRVKNSTATTMPKGSVVYINGVSGNDPTVTFAKATSDFSSAYTLGLTSESITAGQKGWVTTFGELTGLNLSAFTGGDTLYLSGATAGLFTNVKPQAPIHYVRLGTVVKATADGVLVVNVINGFETNELHDVVIASLASGHILQSNGSLWYNVPPAFIPTASYPSLGSLAVRNNLNFYELVSYPSLGSLSVRNNLNFYELVSYPSLGSLSILNQLGYPALISRPSLGTLSTLNNLVHGSTTSLLLDDHTQYALLAGRTGGQGLYGGTANNNTLTLYGTSFIGGKGDVIINPLNGFTAVGHTTPDAQLHTKLSTATTTSISASKTELIANIGASPTYLYANENIVGLSSGVSSITFTTGVRSIIDNDNAVGDVVRLFEGAYSQNLGDIDTVIGLDLSTTPANASIAWHYHLYLSNACIPVKNDTFSIYSAGGKSYHRGYIGINNIFPNAGLDIVGETSDANTYSIYTTDSSGNVIFGVRNDDTIGVGINPLFSSSNRFYVRDERTNQTGNNLFVTGNYTFTTTGTRFIRNFYSQPLIVIASGVSQGGYVYGMSADVLRDQTTDRGGINSLETMNFAFGHLRSLPSPWNQVTNNVVGVNLRPYSERGTITNLYSLFFDSRSSTVSSISGTVTNAYTIYAEQSDQSYFAGRIGIKDTTPDAELDVNQTSTTAAIPTLILSQSDLSEEFINFESTIGTGNPIVASSVATTFSHKIRVAINGQFKYLYLYNA